MIGMFAGYKNPMFMLVFMFLNNVANSLEIVYGPSVHSDVKDYQQYISGRRMDFTFGVAGALGFPITFMTNLLKPYIFERAGITSNFDILYDDSVRNHLVSILCICAIIGAVLNWAPLFFYTLSRQRHRNIRRVLSYRALFDDYAEDALEPELIVEAVENHRRVLEIQSAPDPDFDALKAEKARAAKLFPRSERAAALKAAREALIEATDLVEEKKEIHFYLDEVQKFSLPETQRRVADAKRLVEIGIQGLKDIDDGALRAAQALPAVTKDEKKIRSKELQYAQKLLKMARAIPKAYPNGIDIPEKDEWDRATELPEDTKEQRQAKDAAVKAAEKRLQVYHGVCQPWIQAQKLLEQAEMSVTLFAKVEELYPAAVEELATRAKADAAKREQDLEAKKARGRIDKK
jgi:formiminotetrahydrofolate cyclodeaminase